MLFLTNKKNIKYDKYTEKVPVHKERHGALEHVCQIQKPKKAKEHSKKQAAILIRELLRKTFQKNDPSTKNCRSNVL